LPSQRIELLPSLVISGAIQNAGRPDRRLRPPFTSWFEHLLHNKCGALIGRLTIANQNRIDLARLGRISKKARPSAAPVTL
jgi:hypothetical protein